ncbi:MAG: permease [Chloroflexota bacterium]
MVRLAQAGLGNLAAYLAAHVLLCLVPAFFIAGGLSALIPKESVTRFLGRGAPKYISYPAAALAGSVLAVCSCTIVPLFAGIYKKGAGLGPAITFLFFAPASNILALAYTGVAIGLGLALARLVLSLAFGIGIGMIMALIFRHQDRLHEQTADATFVGRASMRRPSTVFLLVLVTLLLVGTLKFDFLSNAYGQVTLPIRGAADFQQALSRLVPFDPGRGEEGITVQGVVLIALLGLIAVASWLGLERVTEGFNRWTGIVLRLIVLTLMVAAVRMEPLADGLRVEFTGRLFGVVLAVAALGYLARRHFEARTLGDWLWESWRFVKQIFPLLVVGVFVVGVLRPLIRPEWIESLAGENTLLGNLAGVVFGVFMYFPTLVEVPIANLFLSLGMHRGPLLACLMADPELSLQSILIVSAIIGRVKTWTYVAWVALFSALAGLLYGAWADGTAAWRVGLYLSSFLGLLAVALWAVARRENARTMTAAQPFRR